MCSRPPAVRGTCLVHHRLVVPLADPVLGQSGRHTERASTLAAFRPLRLRVHGLHLGGARRGGLRVRRGGGPPFLDGAGLQFRQPAANSFEMPRSVCARSSSASASHQSDRAVAARGMGNCGGLPASTSASSDSHHRRRRRLCGVEQRPQTCGLRLGERVRIKSLGGHPLLEFHDCTLIWLTGSGRTGPPSGRPSDRPPRAPRN